MTNPPTRPTTTKHLATQTGVVEVPRRNDVANDFVRVYQASPDENALELFPEEATAAFDEPAGAAAIAVEPAPSLARAFPWPPDDEEWTPPVHVSPIAPGVQKFSNWSREIATIGAIVAVFLLIVLSVVVWIARDIRATRAAHVASEPPPTIPPLKPRPLSWAQAAALADQRATTGSSSPETAAPAARPSGLGAKAAAPAPAPSPADVSTAAAEPNTVAAQPPAARTNTPAARAADPRPAPADRRPAGTPPRPVTRAAMSAASAAPGSVANDRPVAADTAPQVPTSSVAFGLPAASEPLGEPDVVPVSSASSETRAAVAPRPVVAAVAPASTARTTILRDEDDVRRVLGRYRAAYSALDPYAARMVWPTVDMKALTRAFDQLSSQTLQFNECRVSVTNVDAVATCDATASYVPRVGSRSPRTEGRRLRFELHKANEGWTIDSVSSR